MISQSVQDYLKSIYHLEQEDAVSTAALAKRLDVTSASATSMLKRLAQMGLIEYTSYRGFSLTEAGRKIALEMIRHHRLLELYLHEALGYSWDEVHEEAEHLEHHISEEFEARIDKLLGHPTHDPHGDPIPTVDGDLPPSSMDPLASVDEGTEVLIQRVSDADPELLRYVERLGLMPQVVIRIEDKAPFNGPITLAVPSREEPVIIGHEVAGSIYVLPTDSVDNAS